MPRKTISGYDIQYTTFGQGPRKTLLLHCSLGHSGAYGKLGAALGGAMSLIAFDQPGHGRSEDWRDDGDLQDVVTRIAAEFLDEPMDIIGHSFGGTVALRLAVEHPEKVRSLTVLEPVMLAIAKADDPSAEAIIAADTADFRTAMAQGDRPAAARAFTGRYGDGRAWDSLTAESRAYITDRIHMITAGGRAVNEDYYGLLANKRLEQIKVPALVIDGGEGGPVMEAVCAGLVRRIPNATRVQIAGGGHMVPLTRPDAVAREILAMISQQPAQ